MHLFSENIDYEINGTIASECSWVEINYFQYHQGGSL